MPDWRQLTWGMGLLTLLFLPIAYCLPTSPKWLHSKGRVEQCCHVLYTFASRTTVVLPENIQEIISNSELFILQHLSILRLRKNCLALLKIKQFI